MQLASDLTDESAVAALVDNLRGWDLHSVVAAHGVEGAGDIAGITRPQFDRIMDINFRSFVSLYEHTKPLLESARGTFVALVSQAGLVGEARNSAYCASKFAVSGWARIAGSENAPIRLLCPGCVDTPLLRDALVGLADPAKGGVDRAVAVRVAGIPIGRFAKPAEIAAAALMLAGVRTPRLLVFAPTGGEVLY
jgi:NAD(P)-dependent dehydrogenase (short-subunit alcohol dehydrogenase family)